MVGWRREAGEREEAVRELDESWERFATGFELDGWEATKLSFICGMSFARIRLLGRTRMALLDDSSSDGLRAHRSDPHPS